MAKTVSEHIRSKRPFTYEKAAIQAGYSASTAKRSTQITRSKPYINAMIAENAPLLEGLQEEINAIKSAMRAKDKNKEEYRTLAGSLDIAIRNFQLLSGGATERQVFVLPSEIMQKNTIEQIEEPKHGSIEP